MTASPEEIGEATDREAAALRDLIRAAVAGDSRAMRTLVDMLSPVIHTEIAFALQRRAIPARRDGRQDICDFVQETFVELLANDGRTLLRWDEARGRSLRSFVRLVARRRVARIFRGHRGNPWSDDPTENDRFDYLSPPDDSQSRRLETRQQLDEVLAALRSRLSDRGMTLFELLYVEQRSVNEVCQRMNMSRAAVDTWNSRLRKLVRSLTPADKG
ncbi:MAG: sigma-70 family RNA polymerase sigma factor [Nannocystaceae bacterium]|nr:sigma-70 family RNA polymerase sigma factor [Myxococcales bacterium]